MTEGIRADDRKLYEAKLRYEPQGKTKLSAVSIGFFLLTYMGILNLPLLFIYGLGDLISHGADVNYGIRIALKTAPFLLITHGPLLICRLGTDLQALQMKTRGRLISGLGCAYRTSFFAETTFRGRRCGVEALVCVRYLQPWFRCTTVVDVGTRATEPLFFQSNGLSAGRHAHKLQKLLPVLDEIVGKDELIQIMVEGSHLRAAIHGKTYDANVAATAGWLALSAREIKIGRASCRERV